jgi:ketosteroid isomerase-like protein/limonene-1,2-epoxide hydrolase
VIEGGGEYVAEVGHVAALENGRIAAVDQYHSDDREAMLARFAELDARVGAPTLSEPDRLLADYVRLFNEHDADGLATLQNDGYVLLDHRLLGWGTIRGADELHAYHATSFAAAPDIQIEITEMLASDEHVNVALVNYRGHNSEGGGLFEFPVGFVTAWADGGMVSTDVYEHEDREAMLARFAKLNAGNGSVLGNRPSERLLADVQGFMNARDYGRLLAMVAHDWHLLDRRPLGWGELHGRDGCERMQRSIFDSSPNVHFDVDEVLACDDRIVAARVAVRGEGVKAGPLEVPVGGIYVFDDQQWISVEFYEPDDRDAILARFAELTNDSR